MIRVRSCSTMSSTSVSSPRPGCIAGTHGAALLVETQEHPDGGATGGDEQQHCHHSPIIVVRVPFAITRAEAQKAPMP